VRAVADLFMALVVLLVGTAAPGNATEVSGKSLLEERCGRCHAVGAGVKSARNSAKSLGGPSLLSARPARSRTGGRHEVEAPRDAANPIHVGGNSQHPEIFGWRLRTFLAVSG
jgi:mono/diheme cytochrome c family protein